MWNLNSNDGWQHLEWHPKETILKDGQYVLFELRLNGSSWDPAAMHNFDEFALTEHCSLIMPNVLISLSSVDIMIENLSGWVANRSVFRQVLLSEHSLEFDFQLGPSDELISSTEKPVCVLTYASPRLQWRWLMLVDETCLRNFIADVLQWRAAIERETTET